MGKSTISMAILNSYVSLPEGITYFHLFSSILAFTKLFHGFSTCFDPYSFHPRQVWAYQPGRDTTPPESGWKANPLGVSDFNT